MCACCVCVQTGKLGDTCHSEKMWRSESNFVELDLSFHVSVSPRDPILVALHGKDLYLLSHLTYLAMKFYHSGSYHRGTGAFVGSKAPCVNV